MTAGNRTHVVARLPCSCMWSAMTTLDPDTDYAADGRDIRAFKERHRGLTVTVERDPAEWKCPLAMAGRPCLAEHVRKLKEAPRRAYHHRD